MGGHSFNDCLYVRVEPLCSVSRASRFTTSGRAADNTTITTYLHRLAQNK